MFRICGRYIRTEKLFKEDWLAFACLIPLFCRMALVHVILLFGTNNAITTDLSDEFIRRRAIGSRLVLVSRLFYAATLWMLKLTICEFFKRLTITIWTRAHERVLVWLRWFLLVSFLAVVIADIAECQPITHYWQVVPDPGAKCRQGYAQLLTMGTINVLTDCMLVFFPIPIIISSKMGVKRKIQLVLLFSASLIPAATTLYRIPKILDKHGSQQYRSLMASVEILFATAVANALVLGSFVRDTGVKKQRWKGSLPDTIERTTSRRGTMVRHWGSDEDLVRGLGIGVDPELRGSISHEPRPAPMATAGNRRVKHSFTAEHDWQFPHRFSGTSEETDLGKPPGNQHTEDISVHSPRKVSFFDVGGLLNEDEPGRSSSTRTDTDGESSTQGPITTTWSYENGLSPGPYRRGSAMFLQDIGGLLGPRTRDDEHSRGYELQTIQQTRSPNEADPTSPPPEHLTRQQTLHSLQDVGGLLQS
jgi:hypothetical protein